MSSRASSSPAPIPTSARRCSPPASAARSTAIYWKPVQAGLDGETDAEIVQRLSGLPAARVLPEVYRLKTAASPHLAAERDGVEIDIEGLADAPLNASRWSSSKARAACWCR